MYGEELVTRAAVEDFEAGGASSLPPADGEDRARTDAGRCATVRHEGQGAKVRVPAAPPMPEGRPLPPPGTPERARLEAMPPTRRTSRMTAEEDSRWRDGLKGLFQIRRSRGLPSRSSCWIWPRAWKARYVFRSSDICQPFFRA